jgi:hypothetical protein
MTSGAGQEYGYRVLESSREMPKYTHQLIEEKAELHSGYWQKRGNFHSFLKSAVFLLTFIKSQRSYENFST